MKSLEILALGLAFLALAYAIKEEDSLDNELAAALEAFIDNRGLDAGYVKRGNESKGGADDGDESWAEELDDDDFDVDEDRRGLLSPVEELALEAREATNALTDEEESLMDDLANKLDDKTLQVLMDNRELLADESGMSARSAKATMATDRLISHLLNNHSDLRALAYGDDDFDPEDGAVLDRRGWFKNIIRKGKSYVVKVGRIFRHAKNVVRNVGRVLRKVWNKWGPRVGSWLKKAGKAMACAVCISPKPAPGMAYFVFRSARKKIELIACKICRKC